MVTLMPLLFYRIKHLKRHSPVSIETFGDMLQIYYKGKLIQVHTISRNPINYTKKHYEQSISKQFAGNKDYLMNTKMFYLKIKDTKKLWSN